MQQVRVTGGFNPFDFGYRLSRASNSKLRPSTVDLLMEASVRRRAFCIAFSANPFCPGARKRCCGPSSITPGKPRNSTSARPGRSPWPKRPAQLGVERFVIDDGWFGQRKNDHAGLGDWYVNPQKFPHGLKPVIDRVHALGMDFGFWVEPEMVNPDSDLYRKHPDWVHQFPRPARAPRAAISCCSTWRVTT